MATELPLFKMLNPNSHRRTSTHLDKLNVDYFVDLQLHVSVRAIFSRVPQTVSSAVSPQL